ncbi:MAG: phosphodiesterase [Pseudomonadota bacterium]
MTAILQLSDTHIVRAGERAYGVVDTGTALAKGVAAIKQIAPQLGPIDAIVVTGDLTDFGEPEEYARFLDLMRDLPAPLFAVPGNHDRREPMRAAFSNTIWMPSGGPIQWVSALKDFAIIGLDTLVEGQGSGALCEQGVSFLKAALDRLSPKPVMIAVHHPPFLTGIPTMDAQGFDNRDALLALLSDYEGPAQIICGHVHRMVVSYLGAIPAIIAPGTSHAVKLEFRAEEPNSLMLEPPGMMLHRWSGSGFQSHLVHLGAFEGPYPFYKDDVLPLGQ